MTDKELMQQALDALEYASDMTKPENMSGCECPICVTITALRDRLAQPEQEPVAWITKGGKGDLWWYRSVDENGNDNLDDVPLYITPPQRKPLTFEEILAIAEESRKHVYPSIAFARAIESRHGIKP